jgi:tetratricopeptide (TPR) repeat protein
LYSEIGGIYYLKRQYELALEKYNEAVGVYTFIKGEFSNEVGSCYLNIGESYFRKGSLFDSIKAYEKALQIFKKLE